MYLEIILMYFLMVLEDDELLDYDAMEKLAKEVHPQMIIGGTSAYSRIIDFERMAAVAHEVGALLMIDMAHFADWLQGRISKSGAVGRYCYNDNT